MNETTEKRDALLMSNIKRPARPQKTVDWDPSQMITTGNIERVKATNAAQEAQKRPQAPAPTKEPAEGEKPATAPQGGENGPKRKGGRPKGQAKKE